LRLCTLFFLGWRPYRLYWRRFSSCPRLLSCQRGRNVHSPSTPENVLPGDCFSRIFAIFLFTVDATVLVDEVPPRPLFPPPRTVTLPHPHQAAFCCRKFPLVIISAPLVPRSLFFRALFLFFAPEFYRPVFPLFFTGSYSLDPSSMGPSPSPKGMTSSVAQHLFLSFRPHDSRRSVLPPQCRASLRFCRAKQVGFSTSFGVATMSFPVPMVRRVSRET